METALKKEILVNKTLCRAFGVAAFIILTSLAAFVRIPLPFTPVPLTLQTFFVLLSGALLGSRLGGLTQLSYLGLGALGIPLFTGNLSGAAYLFGPTGGYLIGFVLASCILGKLIRGTRNNLLLTLSFFYLADLLLLTCGALWLKVIFALSFRQAFILGILPFLFGDLLKSAMAALVFLKIRKRAQEIF